jgi:hypothetical protein
MGSGWDDMFEVSPTIRDLTIKHQDLITEKNSIDHCLLG